MNNYQRITRAYQSAVNLRSQRERDADVFDIFASRLREAEQEGGLAIAKALADNQRLWHTVTTITLDDNNPQPVTVRKSLLALARTVIQEMSKAEPDIRLLIRTNGNIAAGLRGTVPDGAPSGGVPSGGAPPVGAPPAGG
jgi:flagellar biosynthesis activator protein FlaF